MFKGARSGRTGRILFAFTAMVLVQHAAVVWSQSPSNAVGLVHPKPDRFEMLTAERIAALPEPERSRWNEYLERSRAAFEKDWQALDAECRSAGLRESKPAPSKSVMLEIPSNATRDWFASDANRQLTEVVLSYQTPTGGWSKAIDYSAGVRAPGGHWTSQSGAGWHYCGTLDNRGTTSQILFLAGVFNATGREDAKVAALKGIEWLLAAQYPSGGWPQNYPVESGYHEAITLNDGAMQHALEALLAISQGKGPFEFTEAPLRRRAQEAFDRGLDCLARAQVKVQGVTTVWCAQHDPLSLAPVGARKKEPPSLSGAESAELIKFLMREGPLTPEVAAMIEPALAWFDAHRITGLRKTKNAAGRTDYVPDAASTEVYWARFYNVETAAPMFAGAQDGIVYPTFSEMAARNKVAYDYFTTRPKELLEKEVVRWKKRQSKG